MNNQEDQPRFEGKYRYVIPSGYDRDMRVPAMIYGDQETVNSSWADGSAKQLINVSTLPSIVGQAVAMPDIHGGYGFPIGGVAAFDYDTGIVSPGGVGYDINCGVTLLSVPLIESEARNRIQDLVDEVFQNVPSGLGNRGKFEVPIREMSLVLDHGMEWAAERGIATEDDLKRTEENGSIGSADSAKVSNAARQRGKSQLGTLGAGNHFLEVQVVDEIFEQRLSKIYGLPEKGGVTVMIHTGSRGLGHQVATDYIKKLSSRKNTGGLRDPQLIYAEIHSQEGGDYLAAMSAAANFAFVNRALIVHKVRQSISRVFGIDHEECKLVYSISHNIAKVEEHFVDGRRRKLMVHRKGATKAFSADSTEGMFQGTGHPVIIPGDMGSASYVITGTPGNMTLSFGSSCHGAGRRLSRHNSARTFRESEVLKRLEEDGIYSRFSTKKVMIEEAPGSYKDIDKVIEIATGSRLGTPVARMKPMGVVKG